MQEENGGCGFMYILFSKKNDAHSFAYHRYPHFTIFFLSAGINNIHGKGKKESLSFKLVFGTRNLSQRFIIIKNKTREKLLKRLITQIYNYFLRKSFALVFSFSDFYRVFSWHRGYAQRNFGTIKNGTPIVIPHGFVPRVCTYTIYNIQNDRN